MIARALRLREVALRSLDVYDQECVRCIRRTSRTPSAGGRSIGEHRVASALMPIESGPRSCQARQTDVCPVPVEPGLLCRCALERRPDVRWMLVHLVHHLLFVSRRFSSLPLAPGPPTGSKSSAELSCAPGAGRGVLVGKQSPSAKPIAPGFRCSPTKVVH